MKLFALPDGTIDVDDRAQWMTPPFDLDWTVPAIPDNWIGGRRIGPESFVHTAVRRGMLAHPNVRRGELGRLKEN